MTKRESKPVEFEGVMYASIRELADAKFEGRYDAAWQSVYRYNQRRRKRPVVWNGTEYTSLAEMGRALGLSRERCRQLINKRDNEQAQN